MLEKPPNAEPEPNAAGTPPLAATGADPGPPAAPPCAHCGSTEPPDAIGLCPVKTCRCMRSGNRLSVVHEGRARLTAADLATRDALMDRLFAERGGRSALDIVSQLRIEDYATAQIQLGKVTRRLETLGAVSSAGNERKSLVATYTTFSARVERLAAELPAPTTSAHASTAGIISNMQDDQLATYLEAQASKFIEHARFLRRAKEFERARADAVVAPTAEPLVVVTTTDPTPAPAPAPVCEYCHQSLTRCAELKALDDGRWEVLHGLDPDVIKKKDDRATQEMFESMHRARTGGDPNLR